MSRRLLAAVQYRLDAAGLPYRATIDRRGQTPLLVVRCGRGLWFAPLHARDLASYRTGLRFGRLAVADLGRSVLQTA